MIYTYKKLKPMFPGEAETSIRRKEDDACIPFDPANADYQEYLEWVVEGYTAEEAD